MKERSVVGGKVEARKENKLKERLTRIEWKDRN